MQTPQISHARDNIAMHAKSGLRAVLKWKIFHPDSVIAGVRLKKEQPTIKFLSATYMIYFNTKNGSLR